MTEIEPSQIVYWKNGKWQKAKQIFTTLEEIAEWYKRNRWRIDGLSVVIPVKDPNQKTLDETSKITHPI